MLPVLVTREKGHGMDMRPVGVEAHTVQQQVFIATRLARFDPPARIIVLFRRRYPDTTCSEAGIEAADPRASVVHPDVHAAFMNEREKVLSDPESVTYANPVARIAAISAIAEFHMERNRFGDAIAAFGAIREEVKANPTAGEAPPEEITEIRRTIVRPGTVAPVAA